MRAGPTVSVIGVTLLSALSSLSAQQPPALSPGQRVRVTIPSSAIRNQVATVGSISVDRLTLLLPADTRLKGGAAGREVTVPLDSVTRLEVSRGQRSHIREGTLIGGLLFAVGGGYYGEHHFFTRAYRHCTGGIANPLDACLPGGIVGGFLGFIVGAVAGAAIGSPFHSEQWEPVIPRRVAMLVVPQAGGRISLSVSLAF